jgi:hypothetical protein
LSRCFIESQALVLKRLGLVKDREAMAGFLFELCCVIVVPAMGTTDRELVVLPLRTEDIRSLRLHKGG